MVEVTDDSAVTVRGMAVLLDLQAELTQVRKLFVDSQGELFWRQNYSGCEDLINALDELAGGTEEDDL